ncbi:MAG: hypothetical protein AAF438_22680 [Pseudomonadota bacterium]
MRGYVKEGIVDAVRAAGGEVYAVTSEPQHLANQAHTDWALNFENVGDPHQEISRTCSERGWLELYVNNDNLEFLQTGAEWKIEHPKGYFQPGVLVLTRDQQVLYRWRSIPSAANLQGTLARPTPTHVWSAVEKALANEEMTGDAALDDDPVIDQAPPPPIFFFATLIANGWFLGVKSLVYSPGLDVGPARMPAILSRWLVFLLFWAAAFFLLPVWMVGLSLTAWVVWILRNIQRNFGDARKKFFSDG